ncbi:MAG: hypothetical protein ABI045_04380 [Flavobacteriales bacterium]
MKTFPKFNFIKKFFVDYVMGILWIGVGAFFLLRKYFGWEWETIDRVVVQVYALLCMMYGLWRMYRGYRRDRIRR